MKQLNYKPIILIIVALILGFSLVRQWRLQEKVAVALSPSENQTLANEVAQLYRQNQKLRKENSNFKDEKLKLTESAAGKENSAVILDESIAKLKVVSAAYPVFGEGVKVWVSHYLALTQLVDLINAIRNSGAEALTINGKRIGPTPSVDQFAGGNYFELEIIGDQDILAEALSRQGGILEQLGMGSVEKADYLVLPAIE